MADLPRILARPNLPQANLPRTSAAAYGAQGFAALARGAEVFAQIGEAADEAESRRLQAETAARINDALVLTKQEEQNPEVYGSFAASRIEEIKSQALGSASNARVRQRLDDALAPVTLRAQTEVKFAQREKQIAKAEGDSVAYLKQSTRDIAAATDPLERSKKEAEIRNHLATMVSTGVYTPKQSAAAAEKLLHDIDEEKAYQQIEAIRAGSRDEVDLANSPFLDAKERNTILRAAKEARSERDRLKKEAEQELLDGKNRELLVATEAAGANLTKLRDDVLRRTDLPFAAQKGWVDRLNKMIEERNKPKGETDPFRKSDSATLGRVFKTILENPDAISSTDISGLIGQGLSVSDALRAESLLESRRNKAAGPALPAGMDPLNMTFKNWERLRGMMAFIPEEERLRNDPSAQIKNDSRATEVWQTVLDRVQQNPQADPQRIFNEVMQPFYEEKVERWYEGRWGFPAAVGLYRWATGSQAPSQEERLAARRELARRGIEVTDENIEKVIERARSRTPAPATSPAPAPPAGGPTAPANEAALLRRIAEQDERIKQLQDRERKLLSER